RAFPDVDARFRDSFLFDPPLDLGENRRDLLFGDFADLDHRAVAVAVGDDRGSETCKPAREHERTPGVRRNHSNCCTHSPGPPSSRTRDAGTGRTPGQSTADLGRPQPGHAARRSPILARVRRFAVALLVVAFALPASARAAPPAAEIRD